MDILSSTMLQRYFRVYIQCYFRGTAAVLLGYPTVLLRYLAVPETVTNSTSKLPQRYFGRYLSLVPLQLTVLLLSFFFTRTVASIKPVWLSQCSVIEPVSQSLTKLGYSCAAHLNILKASEVCYACPTPIASRQCISFLYRWWWGRHIHTARTAHSLWFTMCI